MEAAAVLIADDHPIVRKVLIDSFKKKMNINFLGEANNGFELIKLIEKTIPDIAIIDLEMPRMNGYDTILELQTKYPEIKTVAFSGFLDSINQQRAINMGAFATISKNESLSVIISAIERIIKGESYHSRVFSGYGAVPLKNKENTLLTLREKQILNLIAEGKTSKEIGDIYNISPWTVNKHRSNIKEKLNIKNLAEMIRYAMAQPDKNSVREENDD